MYSGVPKRKDSPFNIMTYDELMKQYPYQSTFYNVMYSEDGGYRWHKIPDKFIICDMNQNNWLFTVVGV